MATQDYAASIQGVAIRVTRLDAAGNLLNGPGDSYVTNAFMRVSFTPEYEEGDEITEKGANGAIAVTYKSPDTLKRINLELALVEPDPELNHLLSGGLLLRRNELGLGGNFNAPVNKSVGWASPGVGDDPAGYGVSLEVWSWAIKDGKRDSTNPYFYWVFPYAKVRQSGDRVIENGVMANTFEGYGLGNVNFKSGPDGRWEFPTAAERPYSYARAPYAPIGLKGFYTWSYAENGALGNSTENPSYTAVTDLANAQSANSALELQSAQVAKAYMTANLITLTTSTTHGIASGTSVTVSGVDPIIGITNKALATNVATLTTGTPHGFAVGDSVVVSGVDSVFNGTVAVTVVGSTTTFSYAKINADITSVVSGGQAVRSLFNGTYTVASVPTANTLTYSHVTNANTVNVANATNQLTVSPLGVITNIRTDNAVADYNVPGNVNYNPDLPIDRIIRSNEDPTA